MLSIGLLGAARIAPQAILAPAKERSDVRIAAVAARDRAKAEAFAAAHDISVALEGYAALIERDDISLVYNALPPSERLEWTLKAAHAGKAILVEKPFAMNAAEARAMVAAAEAASVPLIEAFHYRFHPTFLRAIEIVRAGRLGRLLSAEALFEVAIPNRDGELRWIAGLGGGALMDLGCYCVHALRSLFGVAPTVISASARWVDGVDAALEGALDFAGIPARLRCDMQASERVIRLTVVGEAARLDLDLFVHPHRGGGLRVTDADGRETAEPADPRATFAFQLDHVVDVMAGRAAPLTGGADAIATMAVIDALYTAAGR